MKKTILSLIILLLTTGLGLAANEPQVVINKIILMIPDGFSIEGTTLVRWMNDGKLLAWDPYICGLVRTYAVGVLITDSAPAGTAYATGHKSSPGFIGVMPDEEKDRWGHAVVAHGQGRAPSMTILEAARLQGRSTGVVVTSQVMHATPAAFTAHSPNRGQMDIIAEQQVYNGLDVALGGGGVYLDPQTRTDRQDLWAVLEKLGVTVVRTPVELAAVKKGPVWGIFDGKALTCDKDRDPVIEPSLAEMTSKAIEILDQNEKGFFLMVEGSQIDWAGHGNDPVAYVADALAFNEAVERAIDFARADGHTVVIVVSDHGTGGISIGSASTNKGYSRRAAQDFLDPLKRARSSAYELEKRIRKTGCADGEAVKKLLQDEYALTDLSREELQTVLDYFSAVRRGEKESGTLDTLIGPMLSRRAGIGWTTIGHVGGDVALAVYHPAGDRPVGLMENTEVNRYMQRLFGVDLDALTARYYMEARSAFEARGATVSREPADDTRPLRVRKGRKKLLIPAYRNRVWLNGREMVMPTVTVYNGQDFYVSEEVLKLLDP